MLVMAGDDLGTTFILLLVFLALLWFAGTPGRVFSALLILMGLVLVLLMVAASYRVKRLTGFWDQTNTNPVGPNMQSIQGKYALGSGGLFGVGLGASREKWGWLPESTTDFIFAIIGEELGLVGTLCVLALFGGARLRGPAGGPAQSDTFVRLAAAAITAWIVAAGAGEHRRGDRRAADHRRAAAAGLQGAVVGAGDDGRARYADVVRPAGTGSEPGFGRTRPRRRRRRALSWLGLGRRRGTGLIRDSPRRHGARVASEEQCG